MLSFDITDERIKLISGNEKNGKVKVVSYITISLEAGMIDNGVVLDIQGVAGLINEAIVRKKMLRKDANVSVSSNLIIFKEVSVPRARGSQFKTIVQNNIQQMINTSEEQSVGFTVVEDGSENYANDNVSRVLATSCPKSIVESIKKVFSLLRITLKEVSVSCNSINKIIKKDKRYLNKMPLLLVEIDPTYININIYEKGQLSFSRFSSISKEDYEDQGDYLFQAGYENIYRVLQFQHSKSSQEIENVVFYGDTTPFDRISKQLAKLDIKCSLLEINSRISGFYDKELVNYANAIGSLLKSNSDLDSTNLLGFDLDLTKQVHVSATSIGFQLGIYFAVGVAIVAIVAAQYGIRNNNIKDDISEVESFLTSPKNTAVIDEFIKVTEDIKKLEEHKSTMTQITNCVNSMPVLRSDALKQVDDSLEGDTAEVVSITYFEGIIFENLIVKNQTVPSKMVTNIVKGENNFGSVGYSGYDLETEAEAQKEFSLNLSVGIKGDIDLGLKKLLTTSNITKKAGE